MFNFLTYRYNFYPRAIYQFLNNIAFENHLSIKEVEITILRKEMEHLGFTCDHTDVKNAEKTGEPFCNDCWTRLEQRKAPVYNSMKKIVKEGEYWPLETFLDKIFKSKRSKTDNLGTLHQVTITKDTTA